MQPFFNTSLLSPIQQLEKNEYEGNISSQIELGRILY